MQILINKPEQISILIHAILLAATVYVGSRALIVGFTVSLALLFLYSRFRAKLGLQKIFYGISVFIPCLLLALIFLLKADSSAGRMLIYKISSVMFSDNYAFGVGQGRFGSTFLQYQADYFKKGEFTEKELLLADNTYFAFNDYWQFMVEKGLAGIAVFLSISAVVIKLVIFLFKKYGRNMPGLLVFSVTTLVALAVAALFTHIIEKSIIQLLVLIFILIILYYSIDGLNKSHNSAYLILAVLGIGSFVAANYHHFLWMSKVEQRWEEAQRLCHAGFMSEGLEMLNDLSESRSNHVPYLTFYAYQLIKNEDYKKAVDVLCKAIYQQPSNRLYELMGQSYLALQDTENAEHAFKRAVFMVPNRFRTRKSLFLYYAQTEQWRDALEEGHGILSLPIKIPSPEVDKIRASVATELKKIERLL